MAAMKIVKIPNNVRIGTPKIVQKMKRTTFKQTPVGRR